MNHYEDVYKRQDIDILTETRIEVLRAANKLSADTDMSEVERQSYNYYQKALCDSSHIAYLVFDENRFVGAGGVSFFQVMPTYHNPSGNKAYIMNMYTNPEYRRLGIAYKTLDKMCIRDRPYAYKLIRQLNEELKAKGFITITGRVNRQYFYERLYGAGKEEKSVSYTHLDVYKRQV